MSVLKPFRRLVPALVGATAVLAGCGSNEVASTAPATKPSFGYQLNPNLFKILPIGQVAPTSDERFVFCKTFTGGGAGYAYPSASFNVHTVEGGTGPNTADYPVTLQNGECADFGPAFGGSGATITVTETAISGYTTAWTSETFQKLVGIINTASGSGLSATTDAYGTRGTSKGVGSRIDFTNTLQLAALGDFVWNDVNKNGVQDAGEVGIPGVTVTLTQGATTTTTTTNANGIYSFTSLLPGQYTVTVTSPAGYTASPAHVGNSATDSDYPSATVTLAAGQSDLTIDFGFYVTPRLGGQGCTPGYWKQEQHFDSWKVYTRTDMVDAVFGITFRSTQKNNPSGALNLLQGLGLNGNSGGEALIRHGVAALLNSSTSSVSYLYSTPQVIQMVHDAWVSGNAATMDATKNLLELQNTAGCPLN